MPNTEGSTEKLSQVELKKSRSSGRIEPSKQVGRTKTKPTHKMRAISDVEPNQPAEHQERPSITKNADGVKNRRPRGGVTDSNSNQREIAKRPGRSVKLKAAGTRSHRRKRVVVSSDSEPEKVEAEPPRQDSETPACVEASGNIQDSKRSKKSVANPELELGSGNVSVHQRGALQLKASGETSRARDAAADQLQADLPKASESIAAMTSADSKGAGWSIRDELAALCGYDAPCSSGAIAQRAGSPGGAPAKRNRVQEEKVEDSSGTDIAQASSKAVVECVDGEAVDLGAAPAGSDVDGLVSNHEIMSTSAVASAACKSTEPPSSGDTENTMVQGVASVCNALAPEELIRTQIVERIPRMLLDGNESEDAKRHGGVEGIKSNDSCKENVSKKKTVQVTQRTEATKALGKKKRATIAVCESVVVDDTDQGSSHDMHTSASTLAIVDKPKSKELHLSASTNPEGTAIGPDFGTKIQSTNTGCERKEPRAQLPNQTVRRPLSSISLAGAASKLNQVARVGSDSKYAEAGSKKRKLLPVANSSLLYADTLPSSMLFGGSTFMIPKLKNNL